MEPIPIPARISNRMKGILIFDPRKIQRIPINNRTAIEVNIVIGSAILPLFRFY